MLSSLGLVLLIPGNVLIYQRIAKFDNNVDHLWEMCDCIEFKLDYYKSVRYYDYALKGAVAVALIQLMAGLVICFKRSSPTIVPIADASSIQP